MSFVAYPLKFHPILRSKIWGGNQLQTVLNKPASTVGLGESWEISTVPGHISMVANGTYQGYSFTDLLERYGEQIMGGRLFAKYGDRFPLLIKFIDANQDLSIQLHPDDALAGERHNSLGKTEMWYVMRAEDKANLFVGFNRPMDASSYLRHLNEKSIARIMNRVTVSTGDTFFIEAGRVHAIGAGVLLAEIQQSSDITYRVYDWDRVDDEGKARELHNDLALDAIKFGLPDNSKIHYEEQVNKSNAMVDCTYFKTNIIPVEGVVEKTNDLESFIIYMCVEGKAELSVDTYSESMNIGDTLLVPANASSIIISSDRAKLLEVYI
jgi:mannose-6-phosphate isomerase